MYEEIICAGFGGQGILLMGKVLAQAGLSEGRYVTFMPSYGAEVRGGTAHSMVVISSDEVASPVITSPDVCFAMNEPSFIKFESRLKKNGLFIINTTLIQAKSSRKDIKILGLPLTELANARIGNIKVANMIALGTYIARNKTVSLNSVLTALRDLLPPSRQHLLPINEKALKTGIELVDGKG